MSQRQRQALEFATEAHKGQQRRYTGDAYIVHPIAVAELVREMGGSEDQIIAALLHDTVEDTSVTPVDVERAFGTDVESLVYELTDQFTSKAYPDWNRAKRKSAEAHRMSTISDDAKLIKWCDLMDNTKTIVRHDPKFAVTYLREKADLLEQLGLEKIAKEVDKRK